MTEKEKRNAIKEMRRKFAELEGLNVVISDCKYEGECPPTCTSCEDELKGISRELERKISGGLRSSSNEFKCDYECSIEELLNDDMEDREVVCIKPMLADYDMLNTELEDIGLSEYTF